MGVGKIAVFSNEVVSHMGMLHIEMVPICPVSFFNGNDIEEGKPEFFADAP
jgi:hypothetical protein